MKTFRQYIEFIDDKSKLLELKVLDKLNELGLEYFIYEHPPLRTVEESKALRGEMHGGHTKNLFLRDKKKKNYLITVNENQKIDLKFLESEISSGRLSFGSPERLSQFLGVKPGAVSPLALLNDKHNDVSFFIDHNLLSENILNFHPLVNHLTVSIKVTDFKYFLKSQNKFYNEIYF